MECKEDAESQRGVKIPYETQHREDQEVENAAVVIDKSVMYRFILCKLYARLTLNK